MLPPKEVAYGFKELTHEYCAIVCQYVGGYSVWFNPMVVEDGRHVCRGFFEDGTACVSLKYRSVMLARNVQVSR